MISLALVWSILRSTSVSKKGWMAEHLHEVPILGALYLGWFRPDTYFRQNFHHAFLTLVFAAIKDVVAGLSQPQGIPNSPTLGGPIDGNLHTL